jgi:predicted transcriptional regulator
MDNIQLLTRKEATCQDLLTCLYNPKPIDTEIFFQVATTQNATIDTVAERVNRDRSSVHRCLSKLVSAGLVHKQTKTIKGGGYYHIYIATEPEKIKQDAK